MCPQHLSTEEALSMAVEGSVKQRLAMLDVVDLNGEARTMKGTDEEKNIFFLDGLDKIVKARAKECFKSYYYQILELMDQLGRRPGTCRSVKVGGNQLAIFIGPKGTEEFVHYDHDQSMVATFRVDPDGEYLLSPGVTIKDVWECLSFTAERIRGLIQIETSPK